MNEIEQIQKLLEQYNKDYYKTPQINEIKFVRDNNAWGQFDISQMYNHKYILEIYPGLFMLNNCFIKQILYHEFTHMHDSTKFLSYNKTSFRKIMQIYSEIHASEVETDMILSTQELPYNLDKTVTWEFKLSLHKYMDNLLESLKNEYSPSSGLITEENMKLNFKHAYYFFGAVLSLKNHKINYEYDFSKLPHEFSEIFNTILCYVLDENYYDNYDPKIFISMQQQLENITIKYIRNNNKMMKSIIIRR